MNANLTTAIRKEVVWAHHSLAEGCWFLQDQNNALGRFINGQRIHATAPTSGDRICIGATEFEFRIG